MDPVVSGVVLAAYYLTLGALVFYGLHRFALVVVFYRTRRKSTTDPPAPEIWPRVTVQLPLYNEMYVATRLIDAVCRLDYPRDRLEIQVLDDSTDETSSVVAESVAAHQRHGIRIHHLRRTDRVGFKAGALAAGLRQARGELIAVFDADFVPQRDFLARIVPHFADPEIGMVQARWDHINRSYSLLTRIQAILLDGHFVIEHAARYRGGRFFNFNGTAGVWRRRTIEEAGGWQHDTLTEDLDLSYRAQLAGWKFRLLEDVAVPAELPVDVNGFKAQQLRWAKGSIQTARKLLGTILRSALPLPVKLEAFIHLTSNVSYPLMVLLSVLIFPAMLLRRGSELPLILMIDLPLFLGATLSVVMFYVASQITANPEWRRELRCLPALMALGIGLSVSNARAVIGGLMQRGGIFERTPKYRIEGRGDAWLGKRYRAAVDLSIAVEGLFSAWLAIAFVAAASLKMWMSLPFLYLFLQGYWYILLLSLLRPGAATRLSHLLPALWTPSHLDGSPDES